MLHLSDTVQWLRASVIVSVDNYIAGIIVLVRIYNSVAISTMPVAQAQYKS